jgi:hypothetical protein
MDRIKDVNMDETLKARYMAELKCGRGFLAFLMYDMYGPIPIADLETLQKPEAEIVIPRLSEEAMREYIVSNLKMQLMCCPISMKIQITDASPKDWPIHYC